MSQSPIEIAYVLKAFGRTSETFITNEIHQLETQGVRLALFSIKRLEAQRQHGIISRITAPITYLPDAAPVNESNFLLWLWATLPAFAWSHARLFVQHPLRYLATFAEALRFCWRYRSQRFIPKKVFLKEFLQAGFIAQQALQMRTIRHLHAHFCHGVTTVTMFASRLSGLPFSFTAHAKDIYLGELNPRDLLPRKMERAKFVVTCTGANQRHLNAIRPAAARVHTIYHGLDTSLFTPGESTKQDDAPLILAVGRIVEKKGFDYLIRACHQLRQQGRAYECLIVGGADKHSETIERLISELQLGDTVSVQSSVTQEELKQIYARATMFALPCVVLDNGDRDGIPNVLVEAMAMQLPVVSTDISGIPELVQSGVNGLLVAPKDVTQLAAAITLLLDNEALRLSLGIEARARVLQAFDSTRNTLHLKHLFDAALAAQPHAERLPNTFESPVKGEVTAQ